MSQLSRREFLAAASLTGAGLAAGCTTNRPPARSTKISRPGTTTTAPPDTKSVLVIGAGMAGLGAARSLADAGWPVRVIEARNRIGGRVHTNRDWGVPLEMGASWIHGATNNPLDELADKVSAQRSPTEYYKWTELAVDPRLAPLTYTQASQTKWRHFVEDAGDDVDGGSLGAAVEASAKREELSDTERAELAFFVNTEIEEEFAADASQLSATTYDLGRYTDGPQLVITSGYDAIPRLLAEGLQIVLNTVVTSVERHDDSVTLRAGNQMFEGPAAIVTVPLGVLKSGAITFDPPLPDGHAHAVSALGFGVLSKSYFRFDKRTWDVPNSFYQYLGADDGMWAQWLSLPADAGPIVLAFNAGHRGRYVESAAGGDLMNSALPIARRLFGADIAPLEIKSSTWSVDPYAVGSYSFHAPGSGLDDRRRLQQPISDRLYLAGEAVGTDNPATVHGALLSGRHAAAELMNRLR
ncbi:flavin monoamine oxidase family protein [Mycobacterium szulgai]|uniref:Monoamine oxidase n=1 Tax=Mycobacterium szulgai TaxID=1787 RepID=A0A1X2F6Z5_MYCSZ|nr:NAD(P)/FAD-dependent oxidoreductase [Mycobacterium szulgai]MCV7078707.1 FAD-dependent oxidoreductase [Mycobacterium szulgai]ORX14184.1 monoamine oxidase [Mycobacterium szulgai]